MSLHEGRAGGPEPGHHRLEVVACQGDEAQAGVLPALLDTGSTLRTSELRELELGAVGCHEGSR